tara:strand:+ start:1281 stop:1682 length:402 start_codon:yes stop_codon:yes gene_type:complete
MKKLNGNIYLKVEEVEKEIDIVKCKFRTSHRAILPKAIRYLDLEFVDCIHDEAKNLTLSMNYLYGYGEEYTLVKLVIHKIQERFRDQDSCEDTLQFMQYDLTQTERKRYRKMYENFLVNVFLEECIKIFKKLS